MLLFLGTFRQTIHATQAVTCISFLAILSVCIIAYTYLAKILVVNKGSLEMSEHASAR